MTIAYIGNFMPAFSTENDVTWSLRDLGHEVVTFQENQWQTQDILAACINNDVELLLYTHTHGWETPGDYGLDQLWEALDRKGITTASFHLDYWRGLARQVDVGQHPFWRTDFVFTADGGSQDWFKKKGINHYWLPPAVVKRDCYYAWQKPEYQYDVIFVGSYHYHPEWPYRKQLIDWLVANYGERFRMYGGDTGLTVRQHTLNQVYASAKVVVGDALCLDFKHSNYWSDRVPETLGRGGFLIHPKVKGMEQFYQDKEHLVYYDYGDFVSLQGHIDHYVENYEERERIRLAGHRHVKYSQTYNNRMEQLLTIVRGGKQ